ncbi:hypothetical protein DPMN_049432 [Dreissena polymorpha]|uniref:Uncharacterized protein n=1 Tax=Dreissena polymorpha TaxID=45954 RepID=A0A9D4CFK2_DREPO|nr:hypothetical protein DPMN_049432 [Dreissena polymorpha]
MLRVELIQRRGIGSEHAPAKIHAHVSISMVPSTTKYHNTAKYQSPINNSPIFISKDGENTHTVVCGSIITRPTVQYILQWKERFYGKEPAGVVSLRCTKGGNCDDEVYNGCFPWTRGSAR